MFGSLAKRPETDEHSDVDLAVEGLPASVLPRLAMTASRAAGVHVDVVALESASTLLRWTITRDRILVPPTPVTLKIPGTANTPDGLQGARTAAVSVALQACGARRVLDLGCGRGDLMAALASSRAVEHVTGVDLDESALAAAARRLRRLGGPTAVFIHALVTAWHPAFAGHDAAVAVEVVEHLPQDALPAFERVMFALARPDVVIVTTPNREYNVRWGVDRRHHDHCFEWTREEFKQWAGSVGSRRGYDVVVTGVGTPWRAAGAPTQLARFWRKS
jgi:SAM-dependent methyltransferase